MRTTGSWWDLAACRSADPELFFPISATGAGLADIARAKAVCASCGVRQPCLDYAIGTRQVHGVWGGTSEEERRDLVLGRRLSDSKAS
jgi:WhiB family transcriptional regulator, redox-sensing transcriptional regulator